MLPLRRKLLAFAGVLATVGLYAMEAPAWLWFVTAMVVAIVAVLLGWWHRAFVRLVIMLLLALNTVVVTWSIWPEQPTSTRSSTQGDANGASVSIECQPETTPVIVEPTESLCAIYLHPKWGSQLPCTVVSQTQKQLWPPPPNEASGQVEYRCAITNTGVSTLEYFSTDLQIVFRSAARRQTGRTAVLSPPSQLPPQSTFTFRIYDDTGWDPVVALPSTAIVRRREDRENRPITIDYSTNDGRPPRLGGFGPR